ncbi:polymorphic outer membrane protein middle domain-containing protein [Candidatus Chlamydia sanziniae]|uniref:Outer membrane protein 5 n=1 Tax=Candidatus Chlamydia sanziniae TaxID=1806891 RepID=A0A1A9HWE7_9CHLA|nr:polymorphic outer membrane protein middle domain-containing protein [Candidatus Chlamydia sanziniae]ANH78246.1 outer membrane protein 5 [Candidatus Chlamydia sanziniae]
MKLSIFWLLPFVLFLSPRDFSLTAAEATLDSSDGYEGTDGTTFIPKSTNDSAGTRYSLLKDVSINHAGSTTTPLTTSCFKEEGGDLAFIGNGYSLFFNTINAGAQPGTAISTTTADKNLTLSGFHTLYFFSSPASTVTTGQGTIKCSGNVTFENNTRITCTQNFSTEDGGVISTKNFSLLETSGSAVFIQNQATAAKKGGAIYASGTINIADNTGSIFFIKNTSGDAGGGLSSVGNCSIKNNTYVMFDGNSALGTAASGGAISCHSTTGTPPEVTLIGNSALTFVGNSAVVQGGAIYTTKLILSSGGPTLFWRNTVGNTTAGKGGAIAIPNNGELHLSADNGDIIFGNNTTTTSGVSTRNAIDLGDTAKVIKLRASVDHSIFFYDPITHTGTSAVTEALALNSSDASSDTIYSGSIIFSGEKLSPTEITNTANLISKIKQETTLTRGSLVLKQGVTVQFKGLTQSQDSMIFLDAGTTLEALEESLSLTNLAINLNSLKNKSIVTLKAPTTNKTITLLGLIQLVDNNGNFYESHALKSRQDYPLLTLSTPGTSTVAAVPLLLPQEPTSHYGYQGNWTLVWSDAAHAKMGHITWTRTGYVPNPERLAPLVPNSLWGNFVDIRSLHQLMETRASGIPYRRGMWVSGMANFFHKDRSGKHRGFRHIGGGYVLGVTATTASEDVLSAAFCQFFDRDQDHLITKNHSDVYGASLYFQHTDLLYNLAQFLWGKAAQSPPVLTAISQDTEIFFNMQISYLHADNHMKTRYTAYPLVKAAWKNECLGIEFGTSLPSSVVSSFFFKAYAPFIKIQGTYAHQEDFQERGSEGRALGSSRLINIAIPIGIKLEKDSHTEPGTYDLTLMYVIDAYRQHPHCSTYLLSSDVQWTTEATHLARQALIVRAANHYQWNPYMEMCGQFAFELRSSSRSYNVGLGTKFRF